MKKDLPKAYEPSHYEDGIYEKWEKSGYFNPDNLKLGESAKSYSIAMPPPNRTGTLHMGHAVMLAIQDILIRYHRMKGDRTLWLPGSDHAAIATQTKVEKILKNEGTDRHKLGREKFLKRVVDFAQESHDTIIGQVKKIGCSCDWSREAYTFDKIRNQAVNSVFKLMFDDGLIYRGKRIVNWCPRCQSTLADDEVEYKEERGKLYWLKYGPFVLATSRPETKLGDTAVAVYPGDKRYKKMVGKKYMIPGVLGKFEIKVVADKEVDPKFGSGAIKVTPAHSFTDYEIAQRHKLSLRQIINEEGRMMENCGKYAGLTTKEARKQIVDDMKNMGLIDHVDEGYEHNIALCYRCYAIIEPIPSEQWFIDVNKKIPRYKKSLKELSVEAVRKGVFGRDKIRIIPERFEKNYFHWMDNLRDWCISRQLWFGHRVPVWYKGDEIYVGVKPPREKTNFVFLHGFYRTREIKDPLNWLSQKFEKNDNFWEILPNPDKPSRKEQAKYVLAQAKITKDTVIVAHSLGGILAMKMIEENNLKIKKLVLLATPIKFKSPELLNYNEGNQINFEKIKNNVDEIVVFQPSKDHVMPREEILELTKKLDAKLVKVKNSASHFNEAENQTVLNELKKDVWIQDEDTLDTWFSSGLWTFSTLVNSADEIRIKKGKLEIKADDFKNFHPTNILETGYDILFFWVARMIIMTTYAIGDIPFQDVYLHGLVRDEKGKKMSKSLGNAIDPLDMIKKYGADATRLSLIIGTTPGNDMNLSEAKIAGFRNFTNKLWNVARYILQTVDNRRQTAEISFNNLTLADKYILCQTEDSVKQVATFLKEYKFSNAGEWLREFTWNNLADWYLEATKFQKGTETGKILLYVLRNLLKLWHPFMPFVTEAIWQEFNDLDLIIEKWPEPRYKREKTAELMVAAGEFQLLQDIIINIRNARAENRVDNSKKVTAVIIPGIYGALIEYNQELIKGLRTGIKEIRIEESGEKYKGEIHIRISNIANNADHNIDIYLIGAIDKDKETKRISKEIKNLENLLKSGESKLKNKQFLAKAPAEIIKKEEKNLEIRRGSLGLLKEKIKDLK